MKWFLKEKENHYHKALEDDPNMSERLKKTLKSLDHRGWGNGYVVVPLDHPFASYTEYPHDMLHIHGGITFDCRVKDNNWQEVKDDHPNDLIIGFDTGHYMDTPERWPREEVVRETLELRKQIMFLGKNYKYIDA